MFLQENEFDNSKQVADSGTIVFKSTCEVEKIKQKHKNVVNKLNKNPYTCFIVKQAFKKQNCEELFANIAQLKVNTMCLAFNRQENILKMVAFPIYVKLTSLQLAQNNIANIEAVSFLNCPNLTSLEITVNKIVSIKPLIKTKWKHFSNLALQFNSFPSSQPLKHLSRTHLQQFNSLNLQTSSKTHLGHLLGYMFGPQKFTRPYIQDFNDLSYLSKLNPPFIRTITVLKKTRIQQGKVLSRIKSKYQKQRYTQGTNIPFTANVYLSIQ